RDIKDAGVFTLNPQDTAIPLVGHPENGLVWNLLGTPDQIAPAYVPLMTLVENYWRYTLHPSPSDAGSADPIKVALITSTDGCPIEQAIQAVVTDQNTGIRFNQDQNTLQNSNNGNYKAFPIPCADSNPNANYDQTVKDVADFKPNVIFAITAQ